MPQQPADRIRAVALGFPETTEDFPWGERVYKVRGKVFVFMQSESRESLSLSLKLPAAHAFALSLAFATPTGYGLGRHGWVTLSFGPGEAPPMDLLEAWIEESYRAVAPKKLAALLDGAR